MTLHDFLTRCKVPDARCKVPDEGFAINIFKDHIMQFKFKDIDAALACNAFAYCGRAIYR